MKRDSKMILSFAFLSFALITLSSIYAWFVTTTNSKRIDISAAIIDVSYSELHDVDNILPGENVWLNKKTMGPIMNRGTRNAIVEISFEDCITAMLNHEPSNDLKHDYVFMNNNWYMKNNRLKEVAKLNMEHDNWLKIGDKFYALIPAKKSVQIDKITLNVTGRLGGSSKGAMNELRPRSFEQDSNFHVKYKVSAIQASKEAVSDIFGKSVAGSLPNSWYEF